MTAAGFLGVVAICVFATLSFLVVVAWREDRRERLRKSRSESAACRDISLVEWDPLADLLEDPALRATLKHPESGHRKTR
jgi:hypothetical protein